jgi:uncharacterized membrane protein YqgA involved in biofilm formation
MTGTFINVGTILAGGLLGMILGSKLKVRLKILVVNGLGLFTFSYANLTVSEDRERTDCVRSLLIGMLFIEWWKSKMV